MKGDQKIIVSSMVFVFALGVLNSVRKDHKLPSARFLIGTGILFSGLSLLSEAQPDLAKGLALTVATTAFVGQGDGVLTFLQDRGELDTRRKPAPAKGGVQTAQVARRQPPNQTTRAGAARPRTVPGTLPAFPGIPSTP